MAIEIICSECGSDYVSRDTWAMWDRDQQDWALRVVLDDGHCHVCDRRVHLEERPLEVTADQAA